MKAATFHDVGAPLVVEDVHDPAPGPNELLISVGACGICGTDLHWTENRDRSGGWRELRKGAVLGHEFAGEVVEVGRDIKGRFRPGDSVCALPFIGCGTCSACLTGRFYRCASVDTRATPTLPGAYAELARVGLSEAVRLPPGSITARARAATCSPVSPLGHGLVQTVQSGTVLRISAVVMPS